MYADHSFLLEVIFSISFVVVNKRMSVVLAQRVGV